MAAYHIVDQTGCKFTVETRLGSQQPQRDLDRKQVTCGEIEIGIWKGQASWDSTDADDVPGKREN